MHYNIEPIGPKAAVIHLSGRVNVITSHILRSNFEHAARQGLRRMVVHLGPVQFLDSSGLSALVFGLKLMREKGGTLVLAEPNDHIAMTLRLTNFHRFFEVYEALPSAVAAVAGVDDFVLNAPP